VSDDGESIVAGASLPPQVGGNSSSARRWLWPVLAIVIGVVVVVALFATGIYPSRGGSDSSTPSFMTAAATGNSSARSVMGGPWSLVAASAINSRSGLSLGVSGFSVANCSLTPASLGALGTPLRIPADGSFSSGTSPWWALVYLGRSTSHLLIVLVVNGTAEPLATGTGPCVSTFSGISTVPGGIVDSPTIAAAAWNNGGSAYVSTFDSDHPSEGLNLVLGLYGGGSIPGLGSSTFSVGASWIYAISPCGVPGGANPSGSQPYFLTALNATSGGILLSHASTTTCANLTSVVSELPRDPGGRLGATGSEVAGLFGRP
jgi:hypothetical protein